MCGSVSLYPEKKQGKLKCFCQNGVFANNIPQGRFSKRRDLWGRRFLPCLQDCWQASEVSALRDLTDHGP
jgi:hypothetical protein